MGQLLKVVAVVLAFYSATAHVAAAEVTYGESVVVNGSFDISENKSVPEGWTRSVQMPGAKAEVLIKNEKGNDYLSIKFLKPDFLLQARLIQEVDLVPGKVYELSFRYRTEPSSDFSGDILLTGSGPLYRSIYHPPVMQWSKKKKYFQVPKSADTSKAAIYVQNRSTKRIDYDDVLLKPTDIDPEKLANYQPSIKIQPVTTDDQLLVGKPASPTINFIYQIDCSESLRSRLDIVARLYTPEGKVVEGECHDGKMMFPSNLLPAGDSKVYAILVDKADQAVVAHADLNIQRYTEEMFGASDADFSAPAIFRDKDGVPIFPIGMYGLTVKTSDEIVNELKNNGFNTVHSYSFEGFRSRTGEFEKLLEMLKRFDDLGVKAMVGLPRRFTEKRNQAAELTDWIEHVSGYSSVLFYTADEMYSMRHTPFSLFESTRQIIKQKDPDRQWIVFDVPHQKIAPHVEGLMTGLKTPVSAKLIRARMGQKILFHVFGQKYYKSETVPSVEELRYEIFMPVIYGARGMFYWWLPTLLWHSGDTQLIKQNLYQNTRILAEVGPALVSGQDKPQWLRQLTVSGDVMFCHGTLEGKTYILAGVPEQKHDGFIQLHGLSDHQVKVVAGTPGIWAGSAYKSPVKAGEVVILCVSDH